MKDKAIALGEKAVSPLYFEARHCKACGKYLLGGNWHRLTLDEAAEKLISRSMGRGTDIVLSEPVKKKKHLEIQFIATQGNKQPQEGLLKVYSMQCDFCSKRAGGYFEAFLQVRSDRALAKEDIEKAMRIVESNAEGRDTILRFKPAKRGFDVEIVPVSFIFLLEKKFKAAGLSTIKTAKNVTRDNLKSKDVFQVTVCARYPPYSVGDFVEFMDEVFLITGIRQQVILSTVDRRKKRVDPDNFKDYKILPFTEGMLVSIRKDQMQVMDAEFDTFDAVVPKEFTKLAGAKVKIVNFGGKRLVF